MLSDPYSLLGVAYFVLAFLFVLLLWALERIANLERRVTRMQRAWAREAAFLSSLEDGYDCYAPEDPAVILDFGHEDRRAR